MQTIMKSFKAEFEAEIPSTKKCIERIPFDLYDWKPHEKSMTMGYLVSLVAEIPKWISEMIRKQVIDFQTFDHRNVSATNDSTANFQENIKLALEAFDLLKEEELSNDFILKNGDQVLMQMCLQDSISSTINHWVHHRGQLTVYMRLCDVPVPSIYGPSADERTFG